jgi:hypothetical protein
LTLLENFGCDEILEEQARQSGLVSQEPVLIEADELTGKSAVGNPQLRPPDQLLT